MTIFKPDDVLRELVELDETDARILRALMVDGRASFRSIAKRVGVSTPTVSARVRELESLEVLEGYHAHVRPEKLGGHALFLRVRTDSGALDGVARQLRGRDEVRQLRMASRHNLLVDAIFPDAEAMRAFLSWLGGLEGVEEFEDFPLLETVKDVPPVVPDEGTPLTIDCFYCGKRIRGEPIRLRMDGRSHYLCCSSCATLYQEKYARIKSAA